MPDDVVKKCKAYKIEYCDTNVLNKLNLKNWQVAVLNDIEL